MKVLCLLTGLLLILACSRETPQPLFDVELVVALDNTDSLVRPEIDDLISLTGLSFDPYLGVRILRCIIHLPKRLPT